MKHGMVIVVLPESWIKKLEIMDVMDRLVANFVCANGVADANKIWCQNEDV